MRFTVVVSLFVIGTTTLLRARGNPVNNQEEKAQLKFKASLFTSDYEAKDDNDMTSILLCEKGKIEDGPKVPKSMMKDILHAQGIHYGNGQWLKRAKADRPGLEYGCYERVDGPTTIGGAHLNPLTSVMTKKYPVGTRLFIKELNNRVVDNNARHNGCVEVVDDNLGDESLYLYVSAMYRVERYFENKSEMEVKVSKEDCEVETYKLERD